MSSSYPDPSEFEDITYKDYLALYPTVPTKVLKTFFPDMKRHDLSNFIKDNPHSDEYKGRGGPNGLTVKDKKNTDININRLLKEFLESKFGVSEKDFEDGLSRDKIQKIIKHSVAKKSKKELSWISSRYLTKEQNNERKEKGHTLWYTYLATFYPGRTLLNKSNIHPYYFSQNQSQKILIDELLNALEIYYKHHHLKMSNIRQLLEKQSSRSKDDVDGKMWNYFRRSWRHRDTLIDTKDLSIFGLNQHMIKCAMERYLDNLSRGSDEEKSQRACFIKKYNNSKGELFSISLLHELLEIQKCKLKNTYQVLETWSRKKFLDNNPDYSQCCIGCGDNRIVDLHHIQERATHPELTFTKTNIIPICSHVHNMITRKNYKYKQYLDAKTYFIESKDISKIIEWVKEAHKIPD